MKNNIWKGKPKQQVLPFSGLEMSKVDHIKDSSSIV
jgi:hypothetical protein